MDPKRSSKHLTIFQGSSDNVFFRRPGQDVSVNLSNSQQVRTVAISYLAGLAPLQRGDTRSLELLQNLTDRSVVMLEKNAEGRDTDSREEA